VTPSSQSLALIKWSKPGIIYVARNRVNGKRYVGQTIKGRVHRKCDHAYSARRGSRSVFHAAIRKYGEDGFEFITIQECFDRACLNEAERFWIRALNTVVPNGYNLTYGGEGGEDSEETKKRKSEAFKRWVTPEMQKEWAEKAHAALRGSKWSEERRRNQPKMVWTEERRENMRKFMKTFVLSEEARKKISLAKKGRGHSEEAKAKMSAAHKGRKTGPMSEEQKQKISKAKTGVPRDAETKAKIGAAHRGRKHTQEYKDKMAEIMKGRKCPWAVNNQNLKAWNERQKSIRNSGQMGLDFGHE
jgi:group I intron endonuclease